MVSGHNLFTRARNAEKQAAALQAGIEFSYHQELAKTHAEWPTMEEDYKSVWSSQAEHATTSATGAARHAQLKNVGPEDIVCDAPHALSP